MKHLAALLVLMVVTTCPIRADYLNWTYSANANVNSVSVNNSSPNGGATVSFADYNTPQSAGTNVPIEAYITATNSTTPISFNNSTPFALALKIIDGTTHDSGTLNFTGSLTGSMSATTSSVIASFAPVASNSLTLDGHTYTVNIPSATLAPPTSPQENILASISVRNASTGGGMPGGQPPPPPPPSHGTPEPTSLLLGSLGICCFGARYWWNRQRLPHTFAAW